MKKSALEERFWAEVMEEALPAEAEREFRFCPPRLWRFDFAWPKLALAVEVEGAVWTGGRHTRGGGFTQDAEKYATAMLLGWRVLRVPEAWVRRPYGQRSEAMTWVRALMGLN